MAVHILFAQFVYIFIRILCQNSVVTAQQLLQTSHSHQPGSNVHVDPAKREVISRERFVSDFYSFSQSRRVWTIISREQAVRMATDRKRERRSTFSPNCPSPDTCPREKCHRGHPSMCARGIYCRGGANLGTIAPTVFL